MTIPSEQLQAIFQEIKANFAQHRQIQVTPLAGSPPEQYRITYHLQGFCKKNADEVQICTDHIVTLSLPFGFPHFPPNCKPESPIFHPDFDQAAICIGEFWETHHSLSDLIIHIGRMLCGEIYSTENAFNNEAAIWYKENKNRLPLDTIHQPSTSTTPLPPSKEQSHQASEPLIMDSIDDDFFSSDETEEGYDVTAYVPTEDSLTEVAAPKPPSPLPATSPNSTSQANTLVDREVQHNLDSARQKHQEGESFEHMGQPAKALEKFKEVMALFPDFPGIEKDISRAQYSLEMLGDLMREDSPKEDKGATRSKPRGNRAAPTPNIAPSGQQERKQTSRGLAIVAGGGSVFLLLALTFAYMFFSTQLKNARTMFEECKQLVETDQFTTAGQKCSDALELTYKVLFIKQQEKKLLAEEIKQLQGSEKLQEAMALSTDVVADKPGWQQSMQLADKNMAVGQWKEALAGYTHTLKLASETGTVDHAILEQVRTNIAIAQVNISVQAGEQAMAGSEWDSAKNHFDNAMQLTKKNPRIPTDIISRVQSLAGQVEFNRLMASGEKYFSQDDWRNALSSFEKAQEIERDMPFTDALTRASLHEMIIKTKVFNSLAEGKKAFTDAQWDQAIKQYETALQLLEENSEILRRDNPQQSQQKIAKLMLHAAVIRDKQKVAGHLKNKEFAQAIEKLHAIIKTINDSSFEKDQEFQSIIKETNISLTQAQDDRLIAEQSAYLTENYQKLFIQNNPSLIADNLTNPRVTFLKKIDNKMLYKLQCLEQGHGRPVLLQASYLYDPTNKKWSLFSNDSSEKGKKAEAIGQDILSSAYKNQENLLISEQISYLTDNFQTIFTQHNPDLLRDDLSQPQAIFLKKINGKMMFMLQCLNHGPGSDQPTLLKANVIYDPATHQWDFTPTKEST